MAKTSFNSNLKKIADEINKQTFLGDVTPDDIIVLNDDIRMAITAVHKKDVTVVCRQHLDGRYIVKEIFW